MSLKFATRSCQLNKVPNTRIGSRLDPGFNYVNLTDDQLHAIRIRKGYGITYKQRHANLRLGRCIEKNTQRGEYKKNTNETYGSGRQLERRKAATETPQQFQVPAPALNEVEIRDGGLKGQTFGLGFISSNYKTVIDSQIGCEPSKYVTPGRVGRGTVKTSGQFEGREVAKHRTGQMIASQRPPVTVTKCIGLGKKKKRKQKVVDPNTGNGVDCSQVGSGNAGFAGAEDACNDGFGDIFLGAGSDGYTETSASGVPQQSISQPGGQIIFPKKTRCNDRQRAFDLQTQLALARSGFGGSGTGTGVGSFDFSCINPEGAPSGFPCGIDAECCSDNCDAPGTNTCV
jgi:hypothetical protein